MTYEELITTLPSELQTEIRAATKVAAKSAIDAYHARKRQELQDQELRHQRALDEWLREERDRDDALKAPRVQETAPPTRRKMVLAVLTDFRDETFTRADIQAKILEKYPQSEGRSLSSSISNILKEMAEKGQLERVERGNRVQDPWIYRLGERGESQEK